MFSCFGLKIFDLNTNNLIKARLKANHILTWNPERGVLWVLAIYLDAGDFAVVTLTGWGLKGACEKNFQGVQVWAGRGPEGFRPKSGIGHLGPCQGHT